MSADGLKPFLERGGRIPRGAADLLRRLADVRLVVLDWDGVFNDGTKTGDAGSPFSEIDSMGLNLLRFALWRRDGILPPCALLSGAANAAARRFAEREHFHSVRTSVLDKRAGLGEIAREHSLRADQALFVFDDVLDLGAAADARLRVFMGAEHSPALEAYVLERGLADYLSARPGGRHGLREAADLLVRGLGCYDEVLDARLAFGPEYGTYWAARQGVRTVLHEPAGKSTNP